MGAASVDMVTSETLSARPLAEEVAAGTARLTAVDLDSLTDADLLAVCEFVRRSRRALESLHIRLTAQLDSTRASESELSTSAETFVMLAEQVTKREASAKILAARRARRLRRPRGRWRWPPHRPWSPHHLRQSHPPPGLRVRSLGRRLRSGPSRPRPQRTAPRQFPEGA